MAIGAAELFWIVTAWPNGAAAITFATIVVILFAPRADQAYTTAIGFLIGSILTVAIAATIKFAVLPKVEAFVGFSFKKFFGDRCCSARPDRDTGRSGQGCGIPRFRR